MNQAAAFKVIVEQAIDGELVFPTNVETSLKIQQALDDPDCSLEAAARLVMTEPLLAARVVAVANSVAYSRFGGGVTTIRTAITILGFRTLRSLVASVVMRQLSLSVQIQAVRQQMDQLWQHTAATAAWAHVIARHISKHDAETAMFAGIVHEVGQFYLLSRVGEFPNLLGELHQPLPVDLQVALGRAVLQRLMVPRPIQQAIESLWQNLHVLPPETLGDTLMLANHLAEISSPLEEKLPGWSADTIDFMVDAVSFQSWCSEIQAEVNSLRQALLQT